MKNRKKQVAAFSAIGSVALIYALAGCGSSSPPLELVGTWSGSCGVVGDSPGMVTMSFQSDGTETFKNPSSSGSGTFTVTGSIIDNKPQPTGILYRYVIVDSKLSLTSQSNSDPSYYNGPTVSCTLMRAAG